MEREDSTESMLHIKKGRGVAPVGPSRAASGRSTAANTQEAAQQPADPSTSPRFPFPKMVHGAEGSQQQSLPHPRAKGPASASASARLKRPDLAKLRATGRNRRIRYLLSRPAFSSVRSVQSLRATSASAQTPPSTQRYAQNIAAVGIAPVMHRPQEIAADPDAPPADGAPPVISREARDRLRMDRRRRIRRGVALLRPSRREISRAPTRSSDVDPRGVRAAQDRSLATRPSPPSSLSGH